MSSHLGEKEGIPYQGLRVTNHQKNSMSTSKRSTAILAVTVMALAVGAAVIVIPISFSMSVHAVVEKFRKDRMFTLPEQGEAGIINHMSMCTINSFIHSGHYSIKCTPIKN